MALLRAFIKNQVRQFARDERGAILVMFWIFTALFAEWIAVMPAISRGWNSLPLWGHTVWGSFLANSMTSTEG